MRHGLRWVSACYMFSTQLKQCFASKHLRSVRRRVHREVHRQQIATSSHAGNPQRCLLHLGCPNHACHLHANLAIVRNGFFRIHLLSCVTKPSSNSELQAGSPFPSKMRLVQKSLRMLFSSHPGWMPPTEKGSPSVVKQSVLWAEETWICVRREGWRWPQSQVWDRGIICSIIKDLSDSTATRLGLSYAHPALPTKDAT